MIIHIETIPHKDQAYETCGNFWVGMDGAWQIRVSDMGNADFEWLVAIHEFIEMKLCDKRGIKEEDITKFDIDFEAKRKEGNVDEPGDDPQSPYKREHFCATNIERMLSAELGIDWAVYNGVVENL